jgi:hypothetical protein
MSRELHLHQPHAAGSLLIANDPTQASYYRR